MTPKEIKALRAESGLSQDAFSRGLGVPLRTYQDWEAGLWKPHPAALTLMSHMIECGKLRREVLKRSKAPR